MTPANSTRLGAWAFVSAFQFYLAQAVTAAVWATPFSLADNYISDLGNTVCAPYPVGSERYVCSPWHAGMNASFILTGLSVLIGVLLLRRSFGAGWATNLALFLIALAGPGYIMVGVFPENENYPPHYFGAVLNLAVANVGLALLGGAAMTRDGRSRSAMLTTIGGVVGVVAILLFVTGNWLGIGEGGMERVAAYPLSIWMIAVGIAALRSPHSHAGHGADGARPHARI